MQNPQRYTLTLTFIIVLFFIADLVLDLYEGDVDASFLLELIIFSMATALLFYEIRLFREVKTAYERERDRALRLSGELKTIIEERFMTWHFTPSEGEIGWMLLRGYTFAEIASSRKTKEKTVRQQATPLYAKSGCKNRAEFVALFMADLLSAPD